MQPMRTTSMKLTIAVAVFALALGGGLLLLHSSSSDDGSGSSGGSSKSSGSGGDGSAGAATSDIWKVGDAWTVKVRQDAGAITPDGDKSIAVVPYRFTVKSAPDSADGTWDVHVTQDGAEGPFAKGWHLLYKADADGAMVLKLVATGDEPPLEAELASIALGQQFPYEVRYTAPPKDTTLDGQKLLARSQLPPGQLPQGGESGAAPPAEAPGGDMPATAPPLK